MPKTLDEIRQEVEDVDNLKFEANKFCKEAKTLLKPHFGIDFQLGQPIPIGNPPKDHRFDLVSTDTCQHYIGECKNYTWTKGGNVPSGKIASANEAVWYLSFLPDEKVRFVVMRKDTRPNKGESLAKYYYRTYRHLLRGVRIFEVDLENQRLKEIND